MNNNGAGIKELIYALFNNRMEQEEIYCVRGTVSNISETTWTADVMPIDGGAEIKGVRLNIVKDGDASGFIQVPKDGTTVLVGFESKTKAYLIGAEQLDKIIMRGGALGGLIKISELVEKLNNLENKVNDLVTYSATHTHSGVTAGGGTSGTPTTPVTGSLTPTQVADIEDENITH